MGNPRADGDDGRRNGGDRVAVHQGLPRRRGAWRGHWRDRRHDQIRGGHQAEGSEGVAPLTPAQAGWGATR